MWYLFAGNESSLEAMDSFMCCFFFYIFNTSSLNFLEFSKNNTVNVKEVKNTENFNASFPTVSL